jgi:hypothetical protein
VALRTAACQIALILILSPALGGARPPAAAQVSTVTSADVQRLLDRVNDTSRDIAQLQSRDAALASSLQAELDDARDEAIYLKVKLRKNEYIARSEYTTLRDRIENIRSRAGGRPTPAPPASAAPPAAAAPPPPAAPPTPPAQPPAPGPPVTAGPPIPLPPPPAGSPPPPIPQDVRPGSVASGEVPLGTEFDVRLQSPLSSTSAQIGDRIEATTLVELRKDDRVLVPAGSRMRGGITSITRRTERRGSLGISFDQILFRGRTYPLRATLTQAFEMTGVYGGIGRIGRGAILGGVNGNLPGVSIANGVATAADGQDVDLAAGTVFRVRLATALDLR